MTDCNDIILQSIYIKALIQWSDLSMTPECLQLPGDLPAEEEEEESQSALKANPKHLRLSACVRLCS